MAPLLVLTALLGASPGYWDTPRAGTNFFNEAETADRFRAAAAAGIHMVRLVPDKWRGAGRDFLLGNADEYRGIPPADLARLRAVLDDAQAAGVKVVLGMLSLPGCRWKQNNGDRNDFRLWQDPSYQRQAAEFWRDLALALKGHPALVGLNLLNEPRPERSPATRDVDIRALYVAIIAAIRTVDREVVIVLDGSDDASPEGLARLVPVADARVVYAFHFYLPWDYVDHRRTADLPPHGRAELRALVAPVVAWQKRHAVPSSRVWLAEFGVPRTKPDAARWLGDVMGLAEEHGWHWAFYSFREDTWAAMDYELGTAPLGAAYWTARERGETPPLKRGRNPLWDVITAGLARRAIP